MPYLPYTDSDPEDWGESFKDLGGGWGGESGWGLGRMGLMGFDGVG